MMCDDRDKRIGILLAERDDKIFTKVGKTYEYVNSVIKAQGISPASVSRMDPEALERLRNVELDIQYLKQKVNSLTVETRLP